MCGEKYRSGEESRDGEVKNVPIGRKESFYDKIPLTLKQLDIIIAVLIIAFVVFFVVGTLKGNGYF